MNPLPGKCPICSSQLSVTRLQCGNCGTGIDGSFGLGRLQALTTEQVQFVEVFIKCRGKIKDMEEELGISYPTVVARLNEVVQAMGYQVDESDLSDVDRYEYYQAQVLKPQMPTPPIPPAPAMPPMPPMPPGPRISAGAPQPPGRPRSPRLTTEQRDQILEDLENGKITANEAMEKLNG